MTQILPFTLPAALRFRRTPTLRVVALLVLVLFAAAVLWITIISAGAARLTTGGPHPPLGAGSPP